MDKKKFNLWNRLTAAVVFVISAFTYLSTIEPTASFWDCGEFIASSYKLEVGHPPGNPVFQLFARIFTMFGDNMHAAVLVNSMSALCSALTIFLLYLTIVFLVKRVVRKDENGNFSTSGSVAIFGSAAVGALAYCFSDTFWFSAVEGEVYAMSSLFTALVFWAMTRWYETADQPYANRWIVLISFLMGLSIGIHLLNLLTIPAIVFLFYYKKKEEGTYTTWQCFKILLLSAAIIAVILFAIVPWLPKLAAYFDLFFVNVLSLPYNTGAAFFMTALLALCFWGLFRTLRKDQVLLNTALLCLTTIVVGFSLFSIVIIRSSVKTPTNEYQPDNAFTLVRYLSREQYGSTPLIYGQYFDAPYDLKTGKYWAPLDGKYKKVDSPVDADYLSEGKMLFPRMWNSDPKSIDFYESYMNGKGRRIAGQEHRKPTMGANLAFFFDYQVNWMYWRYFMWNFAGRQNEIHSPSPGELFYGNWESGIRVLDEARLGDQSDAPEVLQNNKGKNHYFMLPLLLGLIGLFFQFARDKRGCWLVFLMFFMTGLAIVVYLNQPPFQVRERDYAYAGSFYSFCIWIGFAVAAIYTWITEDRKDGPRATAVAAAATAACLCVPALMAEENWDDHDRSNRYTAVEMGCNYLNSAGPNGILITHGDNDTFPLWYAQEVEDVRTDVRICNTSLLGTDWHIDQMRYACNKSAPLNINVPHNQYLYGTNEYVYVYDTKDQPMLLSDVMDVFRHPEIKLALSNGKKVDYIMARKLIIPVNKENALKSGIVPEKFADMVPDSIMIEIPSGKNYLTKPELFILDLLSDYQWDRQINVLNMGGDLNVGIKDYLMYDGFSCRITPIRNKVTSSDIGLVDTDHLYDLMTNTFSWDAISREDYFVDYQNLITHLGVVSQRGIFVNAADAFIRAGEFDRAEEMLDKCRNSIKSPSYPLESVCLGFSGNDYMVIGMIEDYYKIGKAEKGLALAEEFGSDLVRSARFYLEFYPYEKANFELCGNYIYYLCDVLKENGEKEFADKLDESIKKIATFASRGASREDETEKPES